MNDKIISNIGDKYVKYAELYKLICWNCPQCGLKTLGKATSYHAQVHGEQEIYYNPFPQEKGKKHANPNNK